MIFLVSGWKKRGSERLSNLLKVTQWGSGRAGIQTQISCSRVCKCLLLFLLVEVVIFNTSVLELKTETLSMAKERKSPSYSPIAIPSYSYSCPLISRPQLPTPSAVLPEIDTYIRCSINIFLNDKRAPSFNPSETPFYPQDKTLHPPVFAGSASMTLW